MTLLIIGCSLLVLAGAVGGLAMFHRDRPDTLEGRK